MPSHKGFDCICKLKWIERFCVTPSIFGYMKQLSAIRQLFHAYKLTDGRTDEAVLVIAPQGCERA